MKSKFSGGRIKTGGIKYPNHKLVYEKLTNEQKEFINTKQLDASRTTTDWIEFFKNLQTHDIAATVKHANFGARVLLITIPLTVLVFVVLFAFTETKTMALTLLFIFIGLIVTWIVTYQISVKLHQKLFPDYFRTVLIPLMSALHEETTEEALVHLRVDLRYQMDKSAHLVTKNAFHQVFDWTVFQINTELLNRIRMDLSVRIHNNLRIRKSKSKRRVFVNLAFEYDKRAHENVDLRKITEVPEKMKIKLKPKPKKHVLRLNRQMKFKDKFFNFYQYTDIHFPELARMIRSGYQAALDKPSGNSNPRPIIK